MKKSQVTIVKSRLSNLRSRQQSKLDEFADARRLDYLELDLTPKQLETLAAPDTLTRLRISLVDRTQPIEGILDITPAEDF